MADFSGNFRFEHLNVSGHIHSEINKRCSEYRKDTWIDVDRKLTTTHEDEKWFILMYGNIQKSDEYHSIYVYLSNYAKIAVVYSSKNGLGYCRYPSCVCFRDFNFNIEDKYCVMFEALNPFKYTEICKLLETMKKEIDKEGMILQSEIMSSSTSRSLIQERTHDASPETVLSLSASTIPGMAPRSLSEAAEAEAAVAVRAAAAKAKAAGAVSFSSRYGGHGLRVEERAATLRRLAAAAALPLGTRLPN